MKGMISCRITKSVQNDYNNLIKETYGQKWGKTGKELENALKLFLTLKGNNSYSDDPDVQELLEAARKTPCTHTHTPDHDYDDDIDSNLDDEEYLDAKFYKAVDKRFDEFERNMKKAIKENIKQGIRAELENTYSYATKPTNKPNPMDVYMAAFIKEYGEWTQVSYGELSSLAVQVHGVSDKRSIQNRINYLLGKGIIKEFSTNVYDVIH